MNPSKVRAKVIKKQKQNPRTKRQAIDVSEITKLQDQLSKIVLDINRGKPSCLSDIRDLVDRFDRKHFESEDQLALVKGSTSSELREFIDDLGDSINLDDMLEKHADCSVDRVEQERRLIISHAFAKRYLFGQPEPVGNPEHSLEVAKPKSFYKFLCPLCLKLIYRCVTTVCGHSFCEVCLDEYLLIKPVSPNSPNRMQSCFVCDFTGSKPMSIRNKPTFASFAIDDMNA